jgi:hypothetical protein
MFPAAHRSSSGAPTVFATSDWELPLRLDYGRSPHAYVNQRLQIQLELLIMSGVPLETCWAFNERWNNKFYYKVAFCWLFLLNLTRITGTLYVDQYTFLIISRWVLLRMKTISNKCLRENQSTYFRFFFFENRAVYKIMWKNIVEPGRPQMKIWRVLNACLITKATNTYSEYVICIACYTNTP